MQIWHKHAIYVPNTPSLVPALGAAAAAAVAAQVHLMHLHDRLHVAIDLYHSLLRATDAAATGTRGFLVSFCSLLALPHHPLPPLDFIKIKRNYIK
uniref:Putative secreted protein n=1 Tax=Anopheles marajoara TaxID=58244 RepID=A0A2M4C9A4_9DIPT